MRVAALRHLIRILKKEGNKTKLNERLYFYRIVENQSNPRVPPSPAQSINSQEAFYEYLKKYS